jgi:hypothetical protein
MLEQLNSCVAYLEKLRVGLQDAQFLKVKSQQVLSLTKRLRQNKRQCWRLSRLLVCSLPLNKRTS